MPDKPVPQPTEPAPVLIAKRPNDGAELFCFPENPWGSSGVIREKNGRMTPCCVGSALEKMPFFLYDPVKVTDPFRREVIEKIQSGEAIKDWLSGTGLKISAPRPVPAPPAEEDGKKGSNDKKNDEKK